MRTFYQLLANALIVTTKNNFVWFALTYWIYLETRSVVSTGLVGGTYLVVTALSSFWFGSLVDHYRKKRVLLGSSLATLLLFALGYILSVAMPETAFTSVASPALWLFVFVLLCGTIAGNLYGIAVPTLVTVLVATEKHDKANGLFGTVMGVSFAITSLASGIILAWGGMSVVLLIAIVLTLVAIVHLGFVEIPERTIIHTGQQTAKIDIRGTLAAIRKIPGLQALIFYNTFNNLLGGVFMALMDAYGLTLVSVQVWGALWAFLSLGFILGGVLIAKRGLGRNPLRTLLRTNLVTWSVCIFFTIQPSLMLLIIGCFTWMVLFPFIEAAEQTIIQKVVPPERQGRVFGFANSVEQGASPLTAFLIGPLTQYIFIPFMSTGAGADLIGGWFGTGPGRGIAIVFVLAGIIGFIVTAAALRSAPYRLLSSRYLEDEAG